MASIQPEPSLSAADSRPAAEKNSQETSSNGNNHEQGQPKHSDCTAAVDKDSSHHSTDLSLQSVAVLPKQPGEGPDAQHTLGEVNANSAAPPVLDSSCSEEVQANRDSKCNGVRAPDDSACSQAGSGPPSSAHAAPEQSTAEKQQVGNAADRLAAQQRQQQVVQYLIDGCDELSETHQQVCRHCVYSVNIVLSASQVLRRLMRFLQVISKALHLVHSRPCRKSASQSAANHALVRHDCTHE